MALTKEQLHAYFDGSIVDRIWAGLDHAADGSVAWNLDDPADRAALRAAAADAEADLRNGLCWDCGGSDAHTSTCSQHYRQRRTQRAG